MTRTTFYLVKLSSGVLDVEADESVQWGNVMIFQAVNILDCGFHTVKSTPQQSGRRATKCIRGGDRFVEN